MFDDTPCPASARPPRRPATEARLRAMARQLRLARGLVEMIGDDIDCPRRVMLMGLARRSLPVCDQARLIGMARSEEESTY